MTVTPPPEREPERRGRDPRLTVLVALTLLSALFAVVQRTPLAPLPHGIDGFVTGLAIGFALSTIVGWFGSRE